MALVYSSVILFWLCYNLIGLVYAVFFMLGREVKRKNERIRAEEPVRIRTKQTDMEGMTLDVSEDGIAFRLSGGEAVAEEEEEHCPVLKGGEQF